MTYIDRTEDLIYKHPTSFSLINLSLPEMPSVASLEFRLLLGIKMLQKILSNVTFRCPLKTSENLWFSELRTLAYSELYQTWRVEHFAKIVNGFSPLPIFAKRSILDL